MFSIRRKKYKQLEDIELISILKISPDRFVFGEIYERYVHLVMGVCLKYLKDEQHAEDLTSIIFENLEAKINKFEITYFKSWLYQLSKNECLMHLRKNHFLFVTTDLNSMENVESDESAQLKEQKIELLEHYMDQLKQEHKLCIQLFYLENKTYLEISEITHLNINQVKSYIQNGKRNLKNSLLNHEEFTRQV